MSIHIFSDISIRKSAVKSRIIASKLNKSEVALNSSLPLVNRIKSLRRLLNTL